jgi:hypothetical protein
LQLSSDAVKIWYQGRQAGIKNSKQVVNQRGEDTIFVIAKIVSLILLRRRSHRNELAKQQINNDCGGAKYHV